MFMCVALCIVHLEYHIESFYDCEKNNKTERENLCSEMHEQGGNGVYN